MARCAGGGGVSGFLRQPWTLRLTLSGPMGERFDIVVNLGEDVISDVVRVNPPRPFPFTALDTPSLDDVVSVLRRKQLRKDLFANECQRLGTMLAERMEDKEGWHGPDRQEMLKDWGPKQR